MDQNECENLALKLQEARMAPQKIEQITNDYKNLDITSAYQIQFSGLKLREKAGEIFMGYKMGLTSEAKRKQMGLNTPCFGVLTDSMSLREKTFSLQGSLQPKIEAELAFKMKKNLKGKVSREQALGAIDSVFPALEILDTRYQAFKYFSLKDVIADNASALAFYTANEQKNPKDVNFNEMQLEFKINEQTHCIGKANDISGDPILSIVQLCKLLEPFNRELITGQVVLAGAATPAVTLAPNMKIELKVTGFESLYLETKE